MIYLITSERSPLVKQSGEAYPPHQTWQTARPAAELHNTDWQITIPYICVGGRDHDPMSLSTLKLGSAHEELQCRWGMACKRQILCLLGGLKKQHELEVVDGCMCGHLTGRVCDWQVILVKCQLSDALCVHGGYPEGFVHGDSGVRHCLIISNKGQW